MNLYRLTAFIVALVVFVNVFDCQQAMTEFINRLFDIPKFNNYDSSNPATFKLAIRALYLIAFVAIIKLILNNSNKSDDEE